MSFHKECLCLNQLNQILNQILTKDKDLFGLSRGQFISALNERVSETIADRRDGEEMKKERHPQHPSARDVCPSRQRAERVLVAYKSHIDLAALACTSHVCRARRSPAKQRQALLPMHKRRAPLSSTRRLPFASGHGRESLPATTFAAYRDASALKRHRGFKL